MSRVDLQDKEFLSALAYHAQALARIILKRSDSGYHLAEDAQVRLNFEFSWKCALHLESNHRKYS